MLEEAPTVAGLAIKDLMALSDKQVLSAVSGTHNRNLLVAEKELMLYHCKLGHAGLQWVESLMAVPSEPPKEAIVPTTCTLYPSRVQYKIKLEACQMGK